MKKIKRNRQSKNKISPLIYIVVVESDDKIFMYGFNSEEEAKDFHVLTKTYLISSPSIKEIHPPVPFVNLYDLLEELKRLDQEVQKL